MSCSKSLLTRLIPRFPTQCVISRFFLAIQIMTDVTGAQIPFREIFKKLQNTYDDWVAGVYEWYAGSHFPWPVCLFALYIINHKLVLCLRGSFTLRGVLASLCTRLMMNTKNDDFTLSLSVSADLRNMCLMALTFLKKRRLI